MPAQQSRRLDEEASETLAGKETPQAGQDRPVGRLQRRSADLASQDRHLVSEHDDLHGEINVALADEPDQLKDAAERPVEEREGHRWMLAAPESRRQSAGRRRWMALSALTGRLCAPSPDR